MLQGPQNFTPVELAGVLGVSESSVKRWIDDGRIGAMRTPGGHRRIAAVDALRFVRETGQAVQTPEVLGLPIATLASDPAGQLSAYTQALERGDEPDCRSLVMLAYTRGTSIAEITDSFVLDGYRQLRAACSHPSDKCVTLHRAVRISTAVLHALRDLAHTPPTDGPAALLADIGYEIDGLPTHTAEVVLHFQGIRCTQLGRSVPEPVLLGAIERVRPRLLWLSASGPADTDTVAALATRAYEQSRGIGCAAVLYGDALPHRLRSEPQPLRAATMPELASFSAAALAMAVVAS
jgi:excisionase family DNA binding protein